MEITLLQGLLLALLVFICEWDAGWEAFYIFRPIVVCFFAGIILGDVQLGLQTGAVAELAYLGMLTVGGTVPPNPLFAGLMTTVLAYKAGISAEAALGLSLPFALLRQWIGIIANTLRSGMNVKLEEDSRNGDTRKFAFHLFFPDVIAIFIYSVVAFLSVYALQSQISSFVDAMPAFLIHGFEISGGVLPAVGLALMLKVMLTKENAAFLFIGFLMMTFLKMDNVLPIAIAGGAIAYIGYLNDKKIEKKLEVNNDGEGI